MSFPAKKVVKTSLIKVGHPFMLYHRCDPLLAGKKNQYHAQPKGSDIDLSPDNEARVQARTCPTADSYKGTQAKPDI